VRQAAYAERASRLTSMQWGEWFKFAHEWGLHSVQGQRGLMFVFLAEATQTPNCTPNGRMAAVVDAPAAGRESRSSRAAAESGSGRDAPRGDACAAAARLRGRDPMKSLGYADFCRALVRAAVTVDWEADRAAAAADTQAVPDKVSDGRATDARMARAAGEGAAASMVRRLLLHMRATLAERFERENDLVKAHDCEATSRGTVKRRTYRELAHDIGRTFVRTIDGEYMARARADVLSGAVALRSVAGSGAVVVPTRETATGGEGAVGSWDRDL
jgi:hypothetical protein